LEVAGEIVSGDLDGSGFNKGDLVCALAHGGGYAEYCVVPIGQCLPIPKGWSVLEAASLPETYFTVYGNVFDRAKLAAGESLLVQGGSSGIGVTAIQMATALGHRVFVTAGTDDKCRACESLGAERGINYRSEDFVEVVKSLTGGKGANVILDMVAGPYVNRELQCLDDDGRLVIIALLGGAGSALHGGYGLVGPAAAGLSAEHGLGMGTAIGGLMGALAGSPHGVLGRAAGGAIGSALGHEFFRRKAEKRRLHGSS
jgi:NADPH2:quinone reductase